MGYYALQVVVQRWHELHSIDADTSYSQKCFLLLGNQTDSFLSCVLLQHY